MTTYLCNQCGFAVPPGPACPRCGAPAYVTPFQGYAPPPAADPRSFISLGGGILLIVMGLAIWQWAQGRNLELVPQLEVAVGRMQCGEFSCELSRFNGTRGDYLTAAGLRLYTLIAAFVGLLGLAGLLQYFTALAKQGRRS